MIAKDEWIKAVFENSVIIPGPSSSEEYSGRITLRIPKSLHKKVTEVIKKEGVSANQYLSHLISMGTVFMRFLGF